MGSGRFKLDVADLVQLAKTSALVGLAAGLTYAGQNLGLVNLGPATALVVPVVGFVIDAALKWTKDNTK